MKWEKSEGEESDFLKANPLKYFAGFSVNEGRARAQLPKKMDMANFSLTLRVSLQNFSHFSS